ncbi:MAG: HAMP domain-containing protein [Clostridia bacterium]|nr:HAMP domain-containing protein [Clostridia bacterium]
MMAAILLIVVVSFGIMAASLTGLVSNYLYRQQIRMDSLSAEKLATTLAPLVQSADSRRLYEEVSSAAGELGGRLLVVDPDGKVQCDSFSLLNGHRLALPEVLSVLLSGESSAYGIHEVESGTRLTREESGYASCCAARIVGTQGTLGVLVLISPIDDMMDGLHDVEQRMMLLFVTALIAAVAVALLFTRLLTKPIVRMTHTIQQMGRGDLSVRVPVRGSG